jgi:hypothetical protein
MRKELALICLVVVVLLVAGCVQKEKGVKPKELKLSDFPDVFKENTLIVIGDNASEIEIQAANEIAGYLENKTGNKALVKRCSEVTEEDKKSNLIIVGTPNSNPMLKEVYAMADVLQINETFPGEYTGVLEIARNPWNKSKAMLLVEGWDEDVVIVGNRMISSIIDLQINKLCFISPNWKNFEKNGIITPNQTITIRTSPKKSTIFELPISSNIINGLFNCSISLWLDSGLKLHNVSLSPPRLILEYASPSLEGKYMKFIVIDNKLIGVYIISSGFLQEREG